MNHLQELHARTLDMYTPMTLAMIPHLTHLEISAAIDGEPFDLDLDLDQPLSLVVNQAYTTPLPPASKMSLRKMAPT